MAEDRSRVVIKLSTGLYLYCIFPMEGLLFSRRVFFACRMGADSLFLKQHLK